MRDASEFHAALRLLASGMTTAAASRALGIPRETLREWRFRGASDPPRGRQGGRCPICGNGRLDTGAYAYLLGLYLGDGWLSACRRGVHRLRISLDARQPGIVDECVSAIATVAPRQRVGLQTRDGCVVVGAYWRHWPCLFPQHGPGRKHTRSIDLAPWQRHLARRQADRLLRGLIHSDGCRVENRVGQRAYPRYFFSNRSPDILSIFCAACDEIGVSWRRPSHKHISVARAADVAALDAIIGPKG